MARFICQVNTNAGSVRDAGFAKRSRVAPSIQYTPRSRRAHTCVWIFPPEIRIFRIAKLRKRYLFVCNGRGERFRAFEIRCRVRVAANVTIWIWRLTGGCVVMVFFSYEFVWFIAFWCGVVCNNCNVALQQRCTSTPHDEVDDRFLVHLVYVTNRRLCENSC